MIWTRYKPRLYRWYCIQWREQRSDVLAGWGREKWSPVCRIKSEKFQFQLSFCSSVSNWQKVGNGSDDGLALNRRQAISMTKMCVTPSQWVKRKHLGLREWLLENVINCILIASCIITLWLPFECFSTINICDDSHIHQVWNGVIVMKMSSLISVMAVSKIKIVHMPQTCGNWLGRLIVAYIMLGRPVELARCYLIQWISKLIWKPVSKTLLNKCSLFIQWTICEHLKWL